MGLKYSNKAQTTLNGAINNSVTSLTVTSATGFPSTGIFKIIVSPNTANEEIMNVTDVSGTTYTVERAAESVAGVQTAFSHSDGATIAHVLTVAGVAPIMPTVVGVGSSASGTGDITPTLHASHRKNDIHIAFIHTSNQSVTDPAGWQRMGPAIGSGTAASAGSMRLTMVWKRDDGSTTDPTFTDPGDHALGQILTIRGATTIGDPFVFCGFTRKPTASTTATGDEGATHVNNCLVVNAFIHNLDSASAVYSSPTNASLSNVTEWIDVATADGTGGGIGVFTGGLGELGEFSGTTVTETSTADLGLTFYIIPEGATKAGAIDRQVFMTAGFGDIWSKPSAAKIVEIIGIAGGGSGSAGRNAATAAGGGGGGGGHYRREIYYAPQLPASATVTASAAGAATTNADGAVGSNGGSTLVTFGSYILLRARGGNAAQASASGAGGAGGAGGGQFVSAPSAGAEVYVYGSQSPPGGTGGTTGAAGSNSGDDGGGGGGGGGTTQAGTSGGESYRGGGGGGGGRSNTNFSTGGDSLSTFGALGGTTVGANGTDSLYPEVGGGGGASGNSTSGPGGTGGWPGGGGGGGGSQSGAQRGGAGGDGVITIISRC